MFGWADNIFGGLAFKLLRIFAYSHSQHNKFAYTAEPTLYC